MIYSYIAIVCFGIYCYIIEDREDENKLFVTGACVLSLITTLAIGMNVWSIMSKAA